MGEPLAVPAGDMKPRKVSLRRIEAADWPIVHSWASLPEFSKYQPWGPNTEEQSREFVAKAVAAWEAEPQTRYSYIALADGKPIGGGEVQVRDALHRHGEIGYGLHPSVWRQGYGTALARALVAVGFDMLHFHRITATCHPDNAGSAAVLKRAGFRYEGRMREVLLTRSGWRDSLVFGLLENWPVPR